MLNGVVCMNRLLVEAYGDVGERALSEKTYRDWFRRFKSVKDKERSDAELQASLDEDDAQTQQQLTDRLNVTQAAISDRLHAMGKVQ